MSASVMPCTPIGVAPWLLLISFASHSSISPSNTVSAGPGHQHRRAFAARHSIVSRPPRVCTSTLASSKPRRMPTATAAQAPVPQASVSPAPRSNTRRRICVARDDLHEAGVDPAREARMPLDQRPVRRDRRGIDVGDALHRVRIAHRHHRHFDLRPSPSSIGHSGKPSTRARRQPGGVERHARRIEVGRAHVDGDAAVVLHAQLERGGSSSRRDRPLVGEALVAHEAHEAARAVAALLDLVAAAPLKMR